MFRVRIWPLQASTYLSQSYARLYVVGIRRVFALSCGSITPSAPADVWRAALPDLLHTGLRSIDEGVLSPQQRQNSTVTKQCVAL